MSRAAPRRREQERELGETQSGRELYLAKLRSGVYSKLRSMVVYSRNLRLSETDYEYLLNMLDDVVASVQTYMELVASTTSVNYTPSKIVAMLGEVFDKYEHAVSTLRNKLTLLLSGLCPTCAAQLPSDINAVLETATALFNRLAVVFPSRERVPQEIPIPPTLTEREMRVINALYAKDDMTMSVDEVALLLGSREAAEDVVKTLESKGIIKQVFNTYFGYRAIQLRPEAAAIFTNKPQGTPP
jgi:DNA-binding MarR family transcriptional regulator